MVCLPCILYPVVSFLLVIYYSYFHRFVDPIVSRFWKKNVLGNEEETPLTPATTTTGSDGDKKSDEISSTESSTTKVTDKKDN